MSRYENAISTLQARSIVYAVENFSIHPLNNEETITSEAFRLIAFLQETDEKHFPIGNTEEEKHDNIMVFLPFMLSSLARFAIKSGDLTVNEYVSMLSNLKSTNEKERNDFGAFGDLIEILVRCFFMRSLHLVNWSTLSVKAIYENDIESKKYGIIEVGHNGKTLTSGNVFDFMCGKYTSVVYGMFDDMDKKSIYSLCREGNLKKAIDTVSSFMCYWSDKYVFQKDMDNLTRGKGITLKDCGVQVVYNDGKYRAFQNAIDTGMFVTLSELDK